MNSSNVVTLIIDGKNKAVTAVKDAIGNLTELDNASKKTGLSIDSVFGSVKSIAAIAGIGLTGAALFSFGKDAIIASAQLGVLRENFKGTTQDIELFQRATAGTVTEASLLKLSNQATDLGLTIKEQIILMSLAEDAADKYGGGVEENFQRVLKASEGGTKGLKDLGIQKAVYDDIVKSYLNDYGVKNLNQLDSETQKWIQVEAVIKATGVTLDDVAKKLPDAADKIEAIGVKWDKFKNKSGEVLLPVLSSILDAIISVDDWAIKAGNDLDHLMGLKGFWGDGNQSKSPDNTQNQTDLMNALSYRTYVDKNGKLVSEEIKKAGSLSAEEIAAQSQKRIEALDKVKKKEEEIKKVSDQITFENSLIGLSDVDRKLMELLKQAESWKNQGIDISLVDETTLIRSDELIRQAFAAKLKAREDTDVKEQEIRDGEYDAELIKVNKIIQLYIDQADWKYNLAREEAEAEEELNRMRMDSYIQSGSLMSDSMEMFYQASGEKARWMFDLYKGFAAAEALASGASAAVAALKPPPVGLGPVFGWPLAIASGLFGIAKATYISSLQPGSRGGGGGGSYSAASAAQSSSSSGSTTNNNNQRNYTVNIHVNSEVLAGEDLVKWTRDKLSVGINKAINDGVIDFG